MSRPIQTNAPRTPPYKLAGVALLVVLALALALVYGQFRGSFTAKTQLSFSPLGIVP